MVKFEQPYPYLLRSNLMILDYVLEGFNSEMQKFASKKKRKVYEFLKKNPYPSDKQFHGFAEKGTAPHEDLEEDAYGLISDFVAKGKSSKGQHSYDKAELKKGIEVEKEHTSNPLIAKKIAKDHLAELKDYYTRLDKMESEAKKEN